MIVEKLADTAAIAVAAGVIAAYIGAVTIYEAVTRRPF